jgi:hypothetical protein
LLSIHGIDTTPQLSPTRPQAIEEQVILSLLRAPLGGKSSGCTQLAALVSTRLSVPEPRVKIKTLQLIMQTLTSPHRDSKSKFRPAIQAAAQEFIASLKEFSCEPEPEPVGDKPAALVRGLARKISMMLTDRLSNVAPEGEFAIKARQTHESKLELGPGASLAWEFTLQSKDIWFSAVFEATNHDGTFSTLPRDAMSMRYGLNQ